MERPRFRTDLVTTPAFEDGERFVDVTDPDSDKTFRFYEVEYAVATAMDGQRNIADLVRWTQTELGLEPSVSEVETVITTLGELGYLSMDQKIQETKPGAGTSPGGDLDISDLSLGAPGRSPIRADARIRREASNVGLGAAGKSPLKKTETNKARGNLEGATPSSSFELGTAGASDPTAHTLVPSSDFSLPNSPSAAAAPPPVKSQLPDLEARASQPEVLELDFNSPPPHSPLPSHSPQKTLMGSAVSPVSRPPETLSDTNLSAGTDLSVDLGQHLSVGTDDVKEAVRQSKVMSAVDVPAGLGDIGMAGSKPVELSRAPETPYLGAGTGGVGGGMSGASAAPPMVRPGATTAAKGPGLATILLFVLLIAAIAAAAYYFLVYAKDTNDPIRRKTPITQRTPPTATPKPELAVSMLQVGEIVSVSVKAPRNGKLGWIAPANSNVSKGDVVAKYSGFEKYERKITDAKTSLARYQGKLEKATKANNKTAIAEAEANVARKQRDVSTAEKAAADYFLLSPLAGQVAGDLEVGAAISAGAEIVRVTSAQPPTATFTVTDEGPYKAGSKVKIATKRDQNLSAECDVISIVDKQVKLDCPSASNIKEGAAIVLIGPVAAAPTP